MPRIILFGMPSLPNSAPLELLGLPLHTPSLTEAADLLSDWMFSAQRTPHAVVTLNPEFVIDAQRDPAFAATIRAADLVTADGVGIVWAAEQLLGKKVPRAPGVDLAQTLMKMHGPALRVYFLGGKPGVAERAAEASQLLHHVQIAGSQHGYFSPEEDERVADKIAASGAHLLLTGMGGGRQEAFNHLHKRRMNVPVAIGCGGTLDVLAGTATLAPDAVRKMGLEFVWRIAGDRSRWHRAPKLGRFVGLVLQAKSAADRP